MTCILDSVQPEPQIVSKAIVKDSGLWRTTSDLYFVRDEIINEDLLLNICKRRDQLLVQICKKQGDI
jgi:hypothetical protein